MGVALAGGVVAGADTAAASSERNGDHADAPPEGADGTSTAAVDPSSIGGAPAGLGPPDPGNPCRPQC